MVCNFTVDAKTFAYHLGLIGPSTRSVMGTPSVSIEVTDGSVVTVGSDQMTRAETRTPAVIRGEAKNLFTTDYEKLKGIVSSVSGELSATITEKGRMALNAKGLDASLGILNDSWAHDQPRATDFASVNPAALKDLIESVHHAAAGKDHVLAHLAAIRFSVVDGSLVALTADGIRAARAVLPMTQLALNAQPTGDMLVSAYRVREMRYVIADAQSVGGDVTLSAGPSWFGARSQNARWSCRLIDGRFPEFESIVERYLSDALEQKSVTLDRDDTIKALKLNSIFQTRVGEGNVHNPVNIEARTGTISLRSRSSDGDEVSQHLPGMHDDDFDARCTATYLIDALGAFDCDEVTLTVCYLNGANVAIIVNDATVEPSPLGTYQVAATIQ